MDSRIALAHENEPGEGSGAQGCVAGTGAASVSWLLARWTGLRNAGPDGRAGCLSDLTEVTLSVF